MKKVWMIMLLVGLLLVGCGTGNKVDPTNGDIKTGGKGIVAGEVMASVTQKEPLIFQYEVKNQTEQEVTLEFTSSQRFDYSVKNDKGEEIFLFSSIAAFLQVMGEEKLKQGESLSYEIDLRDLKLEKGNYVLSVWMTPKEGPKYKVEKEITVD